VTIGSLPALLGDGPGSLDQSVTSLLAVVAFAAGWVAVRRLLGKGFPRLPRPAAWGSAAAAIVCLVLVFVLPPILSPAPASVRPSSTAHVRILSPLPGQTFRGDPARVPVRLQLTGGRIVRFTSTNLRPDEGHIHLFVDGRLVSMSYGLSAGVWVSPGEHTLLAAFVAVDHAPFVPSVQAAVTFRVRG
jgi:hypothetical protein